MEIETSGCEQRQVAWTVDAHRCIVSVARKEGELISSPDRDWKLMASLRRTRVHSPRFANVLHNTQYLACTIMAICPSFDNTPRQRDSPAGFAPPCVRR
jgi:hypothetical protein